MPQLTDPNFGLAYGWDIGESNWKTGMDANMLKLGALFGLAVEGVVNTPVLTANGTRYIVGAAPTGAFAGQTGNVAVRAAGSWAFYAPAPGWAALDKSRMVTLTWGGSSWNPPVSTYPAIDTLLDVANPGGWAFSNEEFTKVPMYTKTTDTRSGWAANNTDYVVPVSGLYQVNAIVRPVRSGTNALPDNSALGLGVGLTAADGANVVWGSGPATGVLFTMEINTLMRLTAGQVVFMFAKHSHTAAVGFTFARMQLARISD